MGRTKNIKNCEIFQEALEAGEIQRLVDLGMSQRQIAERYNVSRRMVGIRLKENIMNKTEREYQIDKMKHLAMYGTWR